MRGSIDIGTGIIGGIGHVNVSGGGDHQAINAVLSSLRNSGGGTARLTAGQYHLGGPIDLSGPKPLCVELMPGAVLNVEHSGPVGAFLVSGTDCGVVGHRGASIVHQTWTNDQIAVHISGAIRGYCRSVLIDYPVSVGNVTTNPMVAIKTTSAIEPEIVENWILPAKGVRALWVFEGHGGRMVHNRIRNESILGIGASSEPPAAGANFQRKCYGIIRLDGAQWMEVAHNFGWGLGDATDRVVEGFFYNSTDNPANTEQGHCNFHHNEFEEVAFSSKGMEIYGLRWSDVVDNRVGWALSLPASLGDAGIYVGGQLVSGSESTDPLKATTNCQISRNMVHNFSASHTPPVGGGNDAFASAFYMSWSKNCTLAGNHCSLIFGSQAILIDLNKCGNLRLGDNYVVSNDITAEYLVAFLGSAASNVHVFGNTLSDAQAGGIQPGITSLDYSGLNSATYTASTISMQSAATAGGGYAKILDSANALKEARVGQLVVIDSAGNKAIRRIRALAANFSSVDLDGGDLADESAGSSITLRYYGSNRVHT